MSLVDIVWNLGSMNQASKGIEGEELEDIIAVCFSSQCTCCFRRGRTRRRRRRRPNREDDGDDEEDVDDDMGQGSSDDDPDAGEPEDEESEDEEVEEFIRDAVSDHRREQDEEDELDRLGVRVSEGAPEDSGEKDMLQAAKILKTRVLSRDTHKVKKDPLQEVKKEHGVDEEASDFEEEAPVDAVLRTTYLDLWASVSDDDEEVKEEPGQIEVDMEVMMSVETTLGAWVHGVTQAFRDFQFIAKLPANAKSGKTALVKRALPILDGGGRECLSWSVRWLEFDHVCETTEVFKGRLTDVRDGMLVYQPPGEHRKNIRDFTNEFASGNMRLVIPNTNVHMVRASGTLRADMPQPLIRVAEILEERLAEVDTDHFGVDDGDDDREEHGCPVCGLLHARDSGQPPARCQVCRMFYHICCFEKIAASMEEPLEDVVQKHVGIEEGLQVKEFMREPGHWIDVTSLCPLCEIFGERY
jgi:hypothetical protein